MPDQSIKKEYFPTTVEASSVINEWLCKHLPWCLCSLQDTHSGLHYILVFLIKK